MRTPHGEFDGYHTSADSLERIRPRVARGGGRDLPRARRRARDQPPLHQPEPVRRAAARPPRPLPLRRRRGRDARRRARAAVGAQPAATAAPACSTSRATPACPTRSSSAPPSGSSARACWPRTPPAFPGRGRDPGRARPATGGQPIGRSGARGPDLRRHRGQRGHRRARSPSGWSRAGRPCARSVGAARRSRRRPLAAPAPGDSSSTRPTWSSTSRWRGWRRPLVAREGGVDVLVHGAGTIALGDLESASVEDLDRQYADERPGAVPADSSPAALAARDPGPRSSSSIPRQG